jgi:hypothetical protein
VTIAAALNIPAEKLYSRAKADLAIGVRLQCLDESRDFGERRRKVGIPVPRIPRASRDGVQHAPTYGLGLPAIAILIEIFELPWQRRRKTPQKEGRAIRASVVDEHEAYPG